MAIKERKEREREEMRELILKAAEEIIALEGIEKLSVRKIAAKIEYSPAIIYHYFKDKDDIVNQQMQRGYGKIMSALASANITSDHPEKRLRELTRGYIRAALEMPDEYKSVQLNTSPEILHYTASMFKGASVKKPALGVLYQCLKDIYRDRGVDDSVLELTAQVIAASTLGFITKLIIEKDLEEEQKQLLIEHFIKCIVDGMVLGKTVDQF